MAVHELRGMTWPAFQAIEREHAVAILPLGAMEAHGPHLPLGTDIVIAEAMARAGAERLATTGVDVVLLPAVPVGPAPFAAAFEGTLDTPAFATTALVAGIARSLARAGVRTLAIANAHHDPAHVEAILEAVRECESDGGAIIVFPDLTKRRWAERLTAEFRSGACHAGRYEGSIVLAAAPGLVDTGRLAVLPPNPRSLVDAIRRGDSTFADAGGPEGYFGWPSEATAAEGREIIERLGELLADAVVEAAAERQRGTNNEDRGPKAGLRGNDDSRLLPLNPVRLGRPLGFSHGMLAPAGARVLYVAGQTATDESGTIVDREFAGQFAGALRRVLAVVADAGGTPGDVARMTIYVSDLETYRASRAQLRGVWAGLMGNHYPAIALVEVTGLVDRGAMVEIEADAVLPAASVGEARTDRR
jgi:creatinine amidohydrolase